MFFPHRRQMTLSPEQAKFSFQIDLGNHIWEGVDSSWLYSLLVQKMQKIFPATIFFEVQLSKVAYIGSLSESQLKSK